jgi:trehalose-phosphatase
MVYEFVPAGDVSKGTAVRQLVKLIPAHRATVRIYLGDDLTDESAYSKLRKRDFGILVGKRRPTAAGHLLRTPKDAVKFLRKLGEITR